MENGFVNSGMCGQFRGFSIEPVRQDSYLWLFKKTIYEFKLHMHHPLMFIYNNIVYQPDRHFLTDQGSLPRIMQWMIQKDRFIGFYFHDSGYRHGGLHVSYDHGETFRFEAMSRSCLDNMLSVMVTLDPEPGNRLTRWAIWWGVRLGGWLSYGKGDERKAQPVNELDKSKPVVEIK